MGKIELDRGVKSWAAKLIALLGLVVVTYATAAQAITPVPAPPLVVQTDGNGVDPYRNTYNITTADVSIGAGLGTMGYGRFRVAGNGWRDNLAVTLSGSSSHPVVSIGARTMTFYNSYGSANYTPNQSNGTKLHRESSTYTFTDRDGTVIVFTQAGSASYDRFVSQLGWATSIVHPNGMRWDFYYRSQSYCSVPLSGGTCGGGTATSVRLQSVTDNFGYQLKLTYSADTLVDINGLTAWNTVTQVTAINNEIDACTPTADSCSLAHSWPYASYSTSTVSGVTTDTVTNALSGVTRFTIDSSNRITGIKRPSSSSDNITVAYDTSSRVQTLTKDGITLNYSYGTDGCCGDATVTIAGPLSTQQVIGVSYQNVLDFSQDALRHRTYTTFDGEGRPTGTSYEASSGGTTITYDSRGNQLTGAMNGGSGDTPVQIQATYGNTCPGVKCNEPDTTLNSHGKTTSYSYDSTHGGVTLIVSPAAGFTSNHPGQRVVYTSFTSTFAGAGTIYLPNIKGACQTANSFGGYGCANTSDELKTTTTYGSASVNYLLTSMTTGAGDGSGNQATNAYTYDNVGNVTYVDGPLSGTADTTRTIYDVLRRVVGVITPDPDGGGSMKMRATRTTYDADGDVTLVEQGTVASQSDADWAAMTVLQAVRTIYDSADRKIETDLLDGSGTTIAVTQFSYDAAGRPQCTAVRMNASVFGSLPSSACTLGTTGSDGPDRITSYVYDITGKTLNVQKAYGTALQENEVTNVYDNGTASCSSDLTQCGTGLVKSVTDANSNTTTYTYDNYLRPLVTTYPDSSYTQWTYDSGSSKVSQRQRDGSTRTFTYDDLDRLTADGYSYGSHTGLYNTHVYDMLGRIIEEDNLYDTGTIIDAGAYVVHYTYDVFGHKASESENQIGTAWTASMQFDVAGRRSKLTWSDGFYVTYDYDEVGELSDIKENGTTTLASFNYDDLGRRTGVSRGNSTSVAYSHDSSSRLSQIADDLAGTSADQTITFTYNEANQINQMAKSNDSYAWTQNYNVSRSYTANNLNQYTAAGSITPTYDGRGNLTSAGSSTYLYDNLNRLRNASGTEMDFTYYPSGKLAWNENAGERYVYDGPNLIAEYDNSGNILRRYVHELGDDHPLVWYEGSGTTNKRWLSSDEKGSVTAITDGSGNVININSYDEWGIPQSTNIGRFQYTGQEWIPELGMYYYKARIYSPTLGRFLQTDSIGYQDGPNWYAYVHNDPVNGRDPTGNENEFVDAIAMFGDVSVLYYSGSGDINIGGYDFGDPYDYEYDFTLQTGGSDGGSLGISGASGSGNGGSTFVGYPTGTNNNEIIVSANILPAWLSYAYSQTNFYNTPFAAPYNALYGVTTVSQRFYLLPNGSPSALLSDNTFNHIRVGHTLPVTPEPNTSYFFSFATENKDTFSVDVIYPALANPHATVTNFPNYVEIRSTIAGPPIGIDMSGNPTNTVVIRGIVGQVNGVQGIIISNAFPG